MIQDLWNDEGANPGNGILRMLLRILSIPYGAAIVTRNTLYDRGFLGQKRLSCPVISVGNITTGGTGKTPTVIAIVRLLQERGYRPAVLSRGYGGISKEPVNIVSDGGVPSRGWKEVGDEPVLMAHSLPGIPVLTGARRYLTGGAAIERFGADVLVLDDAFQHRELFRDADIVLVDGKRPLGNGFLLPRGPLREGPSALSRADMVVRTGSAQGITPLPADIQAPLFTGIHRPEGIVSGKDGQIRGAETLRGKRVVAFAGIGNPEAFREGLSALGAEVVKFRAFFDHHPYSEADMDELRRLASGGGGAMLVTTEKDGVRLADFPDFRAEISFLRISMAITPLDVFTGLLLSSMETARHPKDSL